MGNSRNNAVATIQYYGPKYAEMVDKVMQVNDQLKAILDKGNAYIEAGITKDSIEGQGLLYELGIEASDIRSKVTLDKDLSLVAKSIKDFELVKIPFEDESMSDPNPWFASNETLEEDYPEIKPLHVVNE